MNYKNILNSSHLWYIKEGKYEHWTTEKMNWLMTELFHVFYDVSTWTWRAKLAVLSPEDNYVGTQSYEGC